MAAISTGIRLRSGNALLQLLQHLNLHRLRQGRIPLGVIFSFLITSPLVNEVAVAMFLGSFGVKVTAIYVISGFLLGTIGGMILGRFNLEPLLSDWVRNI